MSSGLSRQILQDRVIQHGVCQERRQFYGLTVQRFAAVGVGHVYATIFGFELLERCWAQAMPAAHLSCWHSSFLLFDHPDYLGFGKRLCRIRLRLRRLKWSCKLGQRAKMHPIRMSGYENDQATELFRQF